MPKEIDERLKKIIEDKKNKDQQQDKTGKKGFEKVGHQQKAFRNKKSGGFFDK